MMHVRALVCAAVLATASTGLLSQTATLPIFPWQRVDPATLSPGEVQVLGGIAQTTMALTCLKGSLGLFDFRDATFVHFGMTCEKPADPAPQSEPEKKEPAVYGRPVVADRIFIPLPKEAMLN